MDLVTLDNTFADAQTENSSESLILSASAPHFSALKNGEIAGDITAASWGKVGAALGNNKFRTNTGVFSDYNGNIFIVTVESTDHYKILNDNGIFKNTLRFERERFFGGGWGEVTAKLMFMEENRHEAAKNYGNWKGVSGWVTQNGITYSNAFDLFTQIEQSGKRFPQPILFVLSGSPITIGSIIREAIKYVIAAAKLFSASIGIPPVYLDTITPILEKLSTGQNVTLDDVIGVAKVLAPESVRGYIDKAANVVKAAAKQDYVSIAKQLGVNVGEATAFFNNTLSEIATRSSLPYSQVTKTLQNIFNIDTVQKFRNTLRSGSAIARIIDDASIVNVQSVQNWLVAAQSGALTSVVPQIQPFVAAVFNETQDVTNVNEYRAFLQTALGVPIVPENLDEITIRSLIQRAIVARGFGNKTFTLPAALPLGKQDMYAAEIHAQTGITVLKNTPRKEFY